MKIGPHLPSQHLSLRPASAPPAEEEEERPFPPPPRQLSSDFSLVEGGQQHFFVWHGPAEAHVSVRPDSRVIASFPAENTGISLWFGEGARVRAVGPARPLQPIPTAGGPGQALEITLRSETPHLVIEEAVLGSVRAIREKLHDSPGLEEARREREDFARSQGLPLTWARETSELRKGVLTFRREALEGGAYEARLLLPPEVRVERRQGRWHLEAPGPFRFRLQASIPHQPLGGYAPEELFSPAALGLLRRLQEAGDPRAGRVLSSMRSLLFLARKGKLMAGSWRFLTYFGRDTLLSLMLLKPALTESAYADGLKSVVERLSPQGQVAHEEDIGPWAVRRRVAELARDQAALSLGLALPPALAPLATALSRPLYDYKMVDDDFLLPLAMERLPGFLEEHPELTPRVLANWKLVLEKAERYADHPTYRNLVRISEGENVGDWRDSNEGLGWGKYPGSVNVDLVPAAVRAIARMASRLPPEEIARAGLSRHLERAEAIARAWDRAREAYRVRLSPGEVRERLRHYLASPYLTEKEKAFYRSRPVGEGGVTLGEFLDGKAVPPALRNGLEFKALSLDEEGKPVEVANSDASFRLFLGDPPREDVESILTLLELEYPVGLMTGVGPVVANPAYSRDPTHHRQLGRDAYHGAVIWSWQSQMLQAGLMRQMGRFPELAPRIERVLKQLERAEARAGELATSELWSHRVESGDWEAAAFGQSSGDQTESNPAQLWSTVYPGVLLRRLGAPQKDAANW